jgi:hypothetical protein
MYESVIQWPLGLDGKELVGAGNTAIVARLDAVIKFFPSQKIHMLKREKLIYERLGRHSSILRYFGVLENAIILQLRVRHPSDSTLQGSRITSLSLLGFVGLNNLWMLFASSIHEACFMEIFRATMFSLMGVSM